MKYMTLLVLVAACGGNAGGSRTQDPIDANTSGMDANGCVAGRVCVTVTNSRSLPAPSLQAAYEWSLWGGMQPVTHGATLIEDIAANFPSQFAIDISNPPPADVLSFFTSINRHLIGMEIMLIRQGSIYASSDGHPIVADCDMWGHEVEGPALYYFTNAGAWLESEGHYTNTESYSQGYHLFRIQVNDAGLNDAGGLCMPPMCPDMTYTLIEVPIDTPIPIDLEDPQTWCQ
jgi:hypothetical protein